MFTPITLGGLKLKNRIMRSPTWEGMAGPRGEMTDDLSAKMVELAKNDVGLVVLSHAFVLESGRAGHGQLGLSDDAVAETYRATVDGIHSFGGAVAVQLAHAGRATMTGTRIGPSDVNVKTFNGKDTLPCAEATIADIDSIVEAFAKAAVRAQSVGVDVVMVHGAHGYLISSFLCPAINKRTDEYGGSIENRARLLLRVVKAVKEATGSKVPIAVKMNTSDFHPEGLTVEDSAKVAAMLADAGVVLLEASGGSFIGEFGAIRRGKTSTEGYHLEGARAWKAAIAKSHPETAVALVGGIRTGAYGDKLVQDGIVDMISIARPLIREPDLAAKWKADLQYKSECISCSLCIANVTKCDKFTCPAKDRLEAAKATKQ